MSSNQDTQPNTAKTAEPKASNPTPFECKDEKCTNSECKDNNCKNKKKCCIKKFFKSYFFYFLLATGSVATSYLVWKRFYKK